MKRLLLILMVSVLTFSITGCDSPEKSGKPQVVTTIGMIADITKNVGGDLIDVKGLMGPGVDPHLYKAKRSDVSALSNADIIFYGGLHLEAKMTDIFEKMASKIITVPVTRDIPEADLLGSEQYEGQHDPHVWFDVLLWQEAVKVVRDTLIKEYPEHKITFSKNADAYLKKLEKLDAYVANKVNEVPEGQRVLVTAHDAFRYFGKAYGFTVKGLQGISTATEAGTKDVQNLAKFIKANKIKAIFVESSIPVRNVKAVQEAVSARGWEVVIGGELFSDAMGTEGTHEGTYIGMVEHNVDTIVNALK